MTDIVDYMRAVDEERCNVEPWTVAKRCADAAAEIERLRAALRFYADPDIYRPRAEAFGDGMYAPHVILDAGYNARAAQPSPQETNMSDTAKPRFEPCPICDNTGWVCEGHGNHPWRGVSNRPDSCDFGPGIPCPSSTCEHSLDRRDDDDNAALRAEVNRLRAALNAAVDVFYEMANLLNDEDFAGEVPGLSGKVIGHRERYHKHMVEELSNAGDAARAALEEGHT